MPRPRFNKLAPEKRERIMEAAAKEFAVHGFNDASLNRILEQAEISKGAAYYYFDDKADVFLTVVKHYSQDMMINTDLPVDQLTAETFWPALAKIYQQQLAYTFEHPWTMGVFKAVSKLSMEALLANEPLAAFMEQIQAWLMALLKRGQEVGVVRSDLPDDLMLTLFWTIDDAHDRWLLEHQDEFKHADIEQVIVPRLIDLLHRLLDPAK